MRNSFRADLATTTLCVLLAGCGEDGTTEEVPARQLSPSERQIKADSFGGYTIRGSAYRALLYELVKRHGDIPNRWTPDLKMKALDVMREMDANKDGFVSTVEAYGLTFPHAVPAERNPHLKKKGPEQSRVEQYQRNQMK